MPMPMPMVALMMYSLLIFCIPPTDGRTTLTTPRLIHIPRLIFKSVAKRSDKPIASAYLMLKRKVALL